MNTTNTTNLQANSGHWHKYILIASIAVAGLLLVLAGAAPASAGSSFAPSGCLPEWHPVDVPNPGTNTTLKGITAIAPSDVWVVGNYTFGTTPRILTAHWYGAGWVTVPNPSPGSNYFNSIEAVSAGSTNDVWAVGFYRENSPNSLIMHWNGAIWSYQSGPYPGSIPWLYGVAAISSSDVWAVGQQGSSAPYSSLIYHYNGTSWSIVPSPNVGILYGAGGSGANDAWAVGQNGIVHWDGTAWTLSAAPSIGTLFDVDATAPNDAWVVGQNGILHWDGTAWTLSTSDGGRSLDALSPSDVWVMGPNVMHWNGTTWTVTPAPYTGLAVRCMGSRHERGHACYRAIRRRLLRYNHTYKHAHRHALF